MTLAGSRLGPYEVLTHIGSGGMGEVWRARDTKLARDVALKFLPESFANDADRLARFQREAKVLASLNHPNIAAIYGFEEGRALVLELVEGPTLADRIALGPIPLEDAMPMARQIAEALEAAHAQGVIHRDLKPGNIKVRPDGTVKVLDFGLAKAFDPNPNASEVSLSPTMTSPAMTRMGVIMGTAAYMSPEQARGSAVDSRADIWSFGVVLYEMLAGKTLFEGPTVSDTLAAVLRADLDWDRLPSNLPPDVRHLLRRSLQRDPKRRLQHIGDARIEIEEWQARPTVKSPETPARRRWGLAVAAALLSAAVVGSAVWSLKPSSASSVAPTSFVIRTPFDAPVNRLVPVALSPDGRQLVYNVGLGGTTRLVHHSLGGFDSRPLEGTEGTFAPFFSPRGDAIGFYSESAGEIQRLRLGGGTATRLVTATRVMGASWGEDGTIVFGLDWGAPLRVARGGADAAVDLTQLDAAAGEGGHVWPQILPGNKAVLFTIWTGSSSWDEARLAVADLETGRHTVVLNGGTSGRYAASGYLVFWRSNALMATPFDLEARRATGEPVRVVPDVRLDVGNGGAHFALSETGTLAYIKGRVDAYTESFVADRSGKRVTRLDETDSVDSPAFSPDGRRVAVVLPKGGTFGIGVYDLERRFLTELPVPGDNMLPTWTKEGERITFLSNAGGVYTWYTIPFDGSSRPESLFSEAQGFAPGSAWSPDGQHFAYARPGRKADSDIWIHTPDGGSAPRPLIANAANESTPSFSPDGRFIAYQSDESDSREVYVRPFPNVDARRVQISRLGGSRPRWSRDGREIFYLSEKGIMRVPVAHGRGGATSFGQPSVTLEVTGLTSFDISPDGRTFAIQRVPIEKAAKEIHVVVNWFEELKRLVPVR